MPHQLIHAPEVLVMARSSGHAASGLSCAWHHLLLTHACMHACMHAHVCCMKAQDCRPPQCPALGGRGAPSRPPAPAHLPWRRCCPGCAHTHAAACAALSNKRDAALGVAMPGTVAPAKCTWGSVLTRLAMWQGVARQCIHGLLGEPGAAPICCMPYTATLSAS